MASPPAPGPPPPPPDPPRIDPARLGVALAAASFVLLHGLFAQAAWEWARALLRGDGEPLPPMPYPVALLACLAFDVGLWWDDLREFFR